MSTSERCVAHKIAWPKAKRRQDMASMVKLVADTARRLGIDVATAINGLDSIHVANTYGGGILPCEVDAEKMKHLSEGEGK